MAKGTTINVGQGALSPGQNQDIKETNYRNKVAPALTKAGKAAEDLIDATPARGWKIWDIGRLWPGGEGVDVPNYPKDKLIPLYKQWRQEQGYMELSKPQRKRLDNVWDRIMKTRNRTGKQFDQETGAYITVGKNEYEWDPTDLKIKALRENLPVRRTGETFGEYFLRHEKK